jgi:hypothetical protein
MNHSKDETLEREKEWGEQSFSELAILRLLKHRRNRQWTGILWQIIGIVDNMLNHGYSASRYESVLWVQICTGYAGNCGLLPKPINVINGMVCLQMVLRNLGILIFIMITNYGNDIIIRAPPVGPHQLIVVCCDVCFCQVKASLS